MFFWMILASLLGVITFGNLHDKIKDKKDFVDPVYEAVALNMQTQHNAAVGGYMDATRTAPSTVNTYISGYTAKGGIIPLANVEPAGTPKVPTWSGGALLPFVRQRLPYGYKEQNHTRSYLFCIPRSQIVPSNFDCSNPTVRNNLHLVRYIITIRQLPRRNDTADRTALVKAIGKATHYSRTIGLLTGDKNGTAGGPLQPTGSHFYVMAGGYSAAKPLYIPDHIICNFPLDDSAAGRALGDADDGFNKYNYMIAVTYLDGLEASAPNDRLANPGGSGTTCDAVTNL